MEYVVLKYPPQAFYLASLNSLPHHPISPPIPLLLQILYFQHHFLLIGSVEAKNRADFNHESFKIEKRKKEALESADSMEDDEFMSSTTEDDKKKKGGGGSGVAKKGSSGGASSMRCCQAEKCTVDLTDAKTYHRRHRVCEHHAKAAVAIVAGIRQRFCQQCSRFHEVSEFDEAKRSCRRRLAGHNERRRKNSVDSRSTEGGSSRAGNQICGQVDDRGRIQIAVQENASNYKHFNVR